MTIQKITIFLIAIFLGVSAHPRDAHAEKSCGEPITDSRDGQVYPTVLIGNQCWMAKNLNTGQMVSDFQQKDNSLIEKSCYDNNPQNCDQYGGLYIWDEMMQWSKGDQPRGICPTGWRLPSRDDWQELSAWLGVEDAGQKLKVTHNQSPAWDGSNESGFFAIPAGVGHRSYFGRQGHWAIYWSSTEVDNDYAWFAQLDNYWYTAPPKYKILYIGDHFLKENGFSVRCIRE
jgi:uncharacterized protein (TIGR02145 family)